MDNKKGFLSAMLQKFNELVPGADTTTSIVPVIEFKDYVTEDGKTLRTNSLAQDGAVMLVTKNDLGEEVESTLPIGTYVVDNEGVKTTVVVEEAGVIKSVTAEAKDETKTETTDTQTGTETKMEGVSAYIELPVGTWTIGDAVYTVIEMIENEGKEDEYKRNVVTSMIPVSKEGEAPVTEPVKEDAKPTEQFSDVKFKKMFEDLEKKYTDLETKLSKMEYADTLNTKLEFSDNTSKPTKSFGKLSEMIIQK